MLIRVGVGIGKCIAKLYKTVDCQHMTFVVILFKDRYIPKYMLNIVTCCVV